MSLHELIYSQSQETSRTEPPPPQSPSPPRRQQRKRPRRNEEPKRSEENELNRFYNLPETIISEDGVERRRKKRRGRPPREAQEMEWETVEEAQDRMVREQMKRERQFIQQRWKSRVYNTQDEVDYGNSVQNMARLVMKRNKKNRVPAVASLPQRDYEESSSSDDEEHRLLGSLHSSQKEEQEEAKKERLVNEYADWDYWQLGYNAPKRQDLEDFYYYRYGDRSPFILDVAGRKKRLTKMEKEVTFTPTTRNLEPEQTYYLKKDLPTTCYTHSSFHHRSCLRALATRCLMNSDDQTWQDRLLRALFSAPTRALGREYHVLTQAMERGSDYVLFQSHKWKDSSVAARALGMTVQDEHTGPRVGYSLERTDAVALEAKTNRTNVVRLLSDGKLPYHHDQDSDATRQEEGETDLDVEMGEFDSNDIPEAAEEETDADAEMEDPINIESEPLLKSDQGDSADVDGGVEADVHVNRATACTQSTKDDEFFQEYLSSQVDYVHEPGTAPPIPSFPLDEAAVVIGGEDRYSRVYHNARIDGNTYAMTLSLLLARLGRARLQGGSTDDAQEQILTFLHEAVDSNALQLDQMNHMRRKRTKQPSAMHYMAMMGLCSFVANSGCSFASTTDYFQDSQKTTRNWSDDESDADDSADAAQSESAAISADMQSVAQLIHQNCADCPTSPSLTLFPRIHVTTGLSLIAKDLPASAAEILSRPFDEVSCRTPFDLMRKTLEHLESNRLLVDSHILYSGAAVNAGHLEHVIHQATDVFNRAMEIDPADITCRAWYVSCLAASLLLCSGNAIDSKAHRLPSSKKVEDQYDMIFSSSDAVSGSSHEARIMMPKFQDLRKETAKAIKDMVCLVRLQKCLRGHLMVSSILEWKQVIALLVGSVPETVVWLEIRRLHSHHTLEWALMENTSAAQKVVKELRLYQDVTVDAEASTLAASVENRPDDVCAWRRLVTALGPVGVKVSSSRRKECKHRRCAECTLLHRGMNVDHAFLAEQKEKLAWWGQDRSSWWDTHVLSLPQESVNSVNSDEVFRISSAIEKRIVKENRPCTDNNEAPRAEDSTNVGLGFDGKVELGWLDRLDTSHEGPVSESDQNEECSNLLPSAFEETCKSYDESKPAALIGLEGEINTLHEILSYKIIVSCHLYSVAHDLVRDGIWFLAHGCFEGSFDASCDSWKCLVWLSYQGLNIPQVLHRLYMNVKEKPKNRRNSPYSVEEEEAVKVGLELFGKSFSSIRDHFPVFADSSRAYLKSIYASLKARGEVA